MAPVTTGGCCIGVVGDRPDGNDGLTGVGKMQAGGTGVAPVTNGGGCEGGVMGGRLELDFAGVGRIQSGGIGISMTDDTGGSGGGVMVGDCDAGRGGVLSVSVMMSEGRAGEISIS